MSSHEALIGRRVLVVEDETMIAMMIGDMLADLGCATVGPAHVLEDAMSLAAGSAAIDVALLDVNLGGRPSFPVADALRARGVPLVFSSGYGQAGLRAIDAGAPVLQKPFRMAELADALARALG